ncbi:MAG: hypothetical protein R3B54_07070 [Bdellovibrionota bacterium]
MTGLIQQAIGNGKNKTIRIDLILNEGKVASGSAIDLEKSVDPQIARVATATAAERKQRSSMTAGEAKSFKHFIARTKKRRAIAMLVQVIGLIPVTMGIFEWPKSCMAAIWARLMMPPLKWDSSKVSAGQIDFREQLLSLGKFCCGFARIKKRQAIGTLAQAIGLTLDTTVTLV